MKYEWSRRGIWMMQGHWHHWNLDFDIPQMPREDTGETVLLKPQPFLGRIEIGEIECNIYYLPDVHIYVAIGALYYPIIGGLLKILILQRFF